MADLSYESELVAASVQNQDIFRRVVHSGIDSDFFDDNEFDRYLFDAALYLDRINNPFTETAFEKIITSDPELDKREQSAYLLQLDRYMAQNVTDTELTLDKLSEVHKQKSLLKTVKEIAHKVKKKSDPDEIIELLNHRLARLETTRVEFEMRDFFADYEERKTSRANIALGLGDRFKFWGNFSEFERYFPRGIGTGATTSVTGPTFAGKSTVLCNLAYLACEPTNGLDTIFIAAENMLEQVGNRFDAIFLDREWDDLFKEDYLKEQAEEDAQWFESISDDPRWGKLIIVKVPAKGFDANTIRVILDSAIDRGYHPRVLIIDSPDHQKPVSGYQQWHLNKGQVYYENKGVTEEYDLISFVSTPMNRTSVKSDMPTNEHVAGSIDISRVIDNQIMFNAGEDDKLIGRARLVVTKNRDDGIIDNRNIAFRFKKSMVLIPFEESFYNGPQFVPDDDGQKPEMQMEIGKDSSIPERGFKVQQ